jgi:hypothetical protein
LTLTTREEHRPKVFQKRVLRSIFGPKKDEVIGGLGNLHNEELHKLYASPNVIRMIQTLRMRWARHVARMEEKINAYRVLVGKTEGREHWEDNIKMDVRETGWGGMDWINLAQDMEQ